MASNSEVGHNKNVANFDKLYDIVTEMGELYNPSNAKITRTALELVKTPLAEAVVNINKAAPLYNNAVALRETKTKPLGKLVSRSSNAYQSLDVSAAEKDNVKRFVSKIRGYQAVSKVKPENADSETISNSQMSYDNRFANFSAYIEHMAAQPVYVPNETDISVDSMRTYHTELVGLSSAVSKQGAPLLTGRSNRNRLLYTNEDSVYELQKDVKAYLLSLGDVGKPYYKAVVKLKFKVVQ